MKPLRHIFRGRIHMPIGIRARFCTKVSYTFSSVVRTKTGARLKDELWIRTRIALGIKFNSRLMSIPPEIIYETR